MDLWLLLKKEVKNKKYKFPMFAVKNSKKA
jgi:hypothetical protein